MRRINHHNTTVTVLDLPANPQTARRARTFVDQHCRRHQITGETRNTALLLTSEIVTNAYLHGRSTARLTLTLTQQRLLVEVADDNSRPPQIVEQHLDALDGRGLTLVDTLATNWGTRGHHTGKVVWFELHLSPT